ncbi:protein phosphatase 2C domain-containing protein [Bacillus gobiensis]|uniref:protein phosphatase 2C domain-containing protein n=1 Tax=Bacillus gobiensis TaxID=1441095 RepID=UPI003D1BB7B3
MIRFEKCSIKGSRELNEDVLVVNEQDQIFAVIDGATSVTPYKNRNEETGGFIAANLLGSFLQDVDKTSSLENQVLLANDSLHELMVESGIDTNKKTDLWSAAFVVVRIKETTLEYVQAGDCMLFARYSDGQIRTITHDQVSRFDSKSLKKSLDGKRLGYHDPNELFQYLLPTIRENRNMANTFDGYSVLNGDPRLADFLEKGTINLSGVERIYMISDGLFYPSTSIEEKTDWNAIVSTIDHFGISNYANKVIQMEESDPQCDKYPRLKTSDDKTGIVIDLSQKREFAKSETIESAKTKNI